MCGHFTWIFTACALAVLVHGCRRDNHPSCTQSLENACQNGACDKWRKFDDVIADPPSNLSVGTCGDRRTLNVSDFYLYSTHVYDARGRLIGSHGGSDRFDQHCQSGFFAGDTTTHDCDTCLLTGYADLGQAACTGKLAEPRIAMCMHDPPAFVRDCSACACKHCYPQLLTCNQLVQDPNADELCRGISGECVSEHCAGCKGEAPDDESDAGR